MCSTASAIQLHFVHNHKGAYKPQIEYDKILLKAENSDEIRVEDGKKSLEQVFESLVSDNDFAVALTGQRRLDTFNEVSHRCSFMNYYGSETAEKVFENINFTTRREVAYHFQVMHLLPDIRKWLGDLDRSLQVVKMFKHFEDTGKLPKKDMLAAVGKAVAAVFPAQFGSLLADDEAFNALEAEFKEKNYKDDPKKRHVNRKVTTFIKDAVKDLVCSHPVDLIFGHLWRITTGCWP